LRQVQSRKEVEKNKCGICGLGSIEENDSEEIEEDESEENDVAQEWETVEWVECEQFKQWFHCSCMELDPMDQEQVLYFRCGCILD
jgi:hypothetical protein